MKTRFSYSLALLLGLGNAGIAFIGNTITVFTPIFLQAGHPAFERSLPAGQIGFALAPALALFILTWDSILYLFANPWTGARSDHTWNRFGRRKGWILLGLPIAVLGTICIPAARSLPAILVAILTTFIGIAVFGAPNSALLGDLFSPAERSKASGLMSMVSVTGGALALLLGGYLFGHFGRSAPFLAAAAVAIVAFSLILVFVKEQPRADTTHAAKSGALAQLKVVLINPERSGLFAMLCGLCWNVAFSALAASASSFAVFSLGVKPGAASMYMASIGILYILCAVPSGLLGDRLGRKRLMLVGLPALTLLFVAAFFFVHSAGAFVLLLVVSGVFWSLVLVNTLPLVLDYSDGRRIGAYTGLYLFTTSLAAILGPNLTGLVVGALGNDYRWMWMIGAVFLGLAGLAVWRVKPRIVQEVEGSPEPVLGA
jgi:MFS family permease